MRLRKAESDASRVPWASARGLGGAVGCVGVVEVGQAVGAPFAQGSAERAQLGQGLGHTFFQGLDHLVHQGPALGRVLGAVDGDNPLVHAPGGLHGRVPGVGEQPFEALPPLVGQQPGPGSYQPPGPVQGVVALPASSGGLLLGAAAALIELVAARAQPHGTGP